MKKYLMLAVFTVASVQLRASHLASELNLHIYDQAWFTITIDNQMTEVPVTTFSTSKLEPGRHFMRVTRLDHDMYGPFYFRTMIFNGYINIPAKSMVNAMIDRYGRFKILNTAPVCPAPVAYHESNYPVPAPEFYMMCNSDFRHLVYSIDRLTFESSRMQLARQAIAHNRFSSAQVTELLMLFTFESSKLELAKLAFRNTIDKNHYYLVNDVFTFESSIAELNNFIYHI